MHEHHLAPHRDDRPGGSGEKKSGMEIVRLKREWRGHPVGAIVKVNDDCANTMFQRDAAEKIASENTVAIKDKLQRMIAARNLQPSKNKG